MKYSIGILAAATMAVAASAGPITTPPPVITALGGNVTAVYVFADAADSSILGIATPLPSIPQIFCNHPTGACLTSNISGDVVSLGNRAGLLTFTLADTTTGNSFDSVNPDAFGIYHALVTTNIADFNLTPAQLAAAAPGLAMAATLTNVTFVGFEDHTLSDSFNDFDYNDLIFAFSNTAPNENPGVPEPLTLSLMGAGLLGAFGLRRIRKS